MLHLGSGRAYALRAGPHAYRTLATCRTELSMVSASPTLHNAKPCCGYASQEASVQTQQCRLET